MSAINNVAGIHETATVEDLIRYACRRFDQRGIDYPPARVSKVIRSAMRSGGPAAAKRSLDSFLDDREQAQTWRGFELYVNGYADPTGARAAVNVDNQRTAMRLRADRGGQVTPNANR